MPTTPTNLPVPTTSVAGPNPNPVFQSSLPAIPTPPANLALPNPTPSILQAQQPTQGGANAPVTLTAAQFQALYGNPSSASPTGPSGATGPTTLTADQFQQQYGTGATGATGGSGISQGLADFAKGIFSPVATLLARPVQAGAELLGATSGQVDSATNTAENAVGGVLKNVPFIGNALADTTQGLVAPVDQNAGDVMKDVGRGAETVALGLGAAPEAAAEEGAAAALKGAESITPVTDAAKAVLPAAHISTPIASGALFGAGNSVANGNPLFSTQTAEGALEGGAAGKLLDLVGTPLLNAIGKPIGVITPQIVKDVMAGGADAVSSFMAQHELPVVGGITKPLSEGIQNVANAVDAGVNKAASNLGGGVATGAKDAFMSQYPDFDPVGHFVQANENDLTRPAMSNESRFADASQIYENAKDQGIDLGQEMTKLGITHDDISKGGIYNTKNLANKITQSEYDFGNKVVRPAIRDVQAGLPNTSVADVRNSLLNRVNAIPSSTLNDTDREWMVNQINRQYGEDSAAARAHPNGYNLEDLHDNRIVENGNAKYNKFSTPAQNRPGQLAKYKAQTFANLFDNKSPVEFQDVRGEQEKNFKVAQYLKALNGKKVPEGITQKAVRLFGRGLGSVLGSHVGGYPGLFVGGRLGDALFDRFDTLPNPLKGAALRSAFENKAEPEVFQALQKRVGEAQAQQLMRIGKGLTLPASGESSGAAAIEKASPTLFSTSNGRAAPTLQEAVDISNAESKLKTPTTNTKSPAYKAKVLAAQENLGPYVPPRNLPVVDAGKPGLSKFADLPVANSVPAVYGPDREVLPDMKNLPVIDMGKPKKGVRGLNDIKF